jgi:hypothetical protein
MKTATLFILSVCILGAFGIQSGKSLHFVFANCQASASVEFERVESSSNETIGE